MFFRLALYVYEYLLHVGAQKSAQTFLSEVCLPCLFFSLHKVTMCASEINLCWFRKNGDNLAYLFTLISIDFWFCKSQFAMSFCMPLHNYFCCDLLALLSDLVLQWRNICLFSIINVHVWMCIDHVPSWWYSNLLLVSPIVNDGPFLNVQQSGILYWFRYVFLPCF